MPNVRYSDNLLVPQNVREMLSSRSRGVQIEEIRLNHDDSVYIYGEYHGWRACYCTHLRNRDGLSINDLIQARDYIRNECRGMQRSMERAQTNAAPPRPEVNQNPDGNFYIEHHVINHHEERAEAEAPPSQPEAWTCPQCHRTEPHFHYDGFLGAPRWFSRIQREWEEEQRSQRQIRCPHCNHARKKKITATRKFRNKHGEIYTIRDDVFYRCSKCKKCFYDKDLRKAHKHRRKLSYQIFKDTNRFRPA